ncbi:MAG TPA: uroporphyrinogen decarboxylase [Stellaceae bacterium]|jgi:uroporphyrinogen decarboxylase|nr:uroporphyrinogen decarboxylase [Stellaceae bacterium]
MAGAKTKPLLRVLAGETLSPPPWWLMRQAGRYLPEYRAVRARASDFVELCLTPGLAAELTMQPVRRYGMDAAILFSDILLLPHALGQKLTFRDGEGPVLEPVAGNAGVALLDGAHAVSRLEPVLEAVRQVRASLGPQTALIGFAGAPWTVATYMVEGGVSRDFRQVKAWAYGDPQGFAALIEVLIEATIELLAAEIAAGAEIVQLFDSWAGILPEAAFARWIIAPTARIVAALRGRQPDCPIIGFPRGAGVLYERYTAETGVDAVALDTMVSAGFAGARLRPLATVQGNLDPVLLLTGGAALESAVRDMRRAFSGGPWVFNLGHGVLPQTPTENVSVLAGLLAEPVVAP